jgi:hypothetical protein
MDLFIIVWQTVTFIGLIMFFIYIACAVTYHKHIEPEAIEQPVTPTPSYKNFAPPSYDTVCKKTKSSSHLFIVSVHGARNMSSPQSLAESSPGVRDVETSSTHL